MSVLHLGIKAKFIIILMIAAVLPLAIGIAAIWVIGYRDFKKDHGVLFESAASHLALGLTEKIQSQFEKLNELTHDAQLVDALSHENERFQSLTGAGLSNRVAAIDATWTDRASTNSEVQAVLTNMLARSLVEFR